MRFFKNILIFWLKIYNDYFKEMKLTKYKSQIYFCSTHIMLSNRRKDLISCMKFCRNMVYNLSQSFRNHILQGKQSPPLFWLSCLWLTYLYLLGCVHVMICDKPLILFLTVRKFFSMKIWIEWLSSNAFLVFIFPPGRVLGNMSNTHPLPLTFSL